MPPISNNVKMRFGPLLAGCCADVLLQGVLFVQAVTYFHQYRDDRITLKLAVAGLIILTTLKSSQSFAMLWIEFIDSFANPALATTQMLCQWTIRANPLMAALLGSYVRAYFCYRLYFISNTWWAIALIAAIDSLALGVVSVATYWMPNTSIHETVILFLTLHFSLLFVGDLLLTLLTAFFLTRSKKGITPQAYGIINALICLTLETAAPGAVCSLITLIVSQLPIYQVEVAFNEVQPKLYAVSMMWTLNARHELRSMPWGNRSTLSYITSGIKSRSTIKGPVETVHRDAFEI